MRVEAYFAAAEVDPGAMVGRTALVIDVLRATSTMIEALANGARSIYPTESSEEAIRLIGSLGREGTLLCGERRGLAPEGFDLGNSPLEFTSDRVSNQQLVMTTTNGTRAFLAAHGADRVIAAALLNLKAAAKTAAEVEDVAVICAGREDQFSLEDAICAGLLVRRITKAWGAPPEMNDAARGALSLAEQLEPDQGFLAATAGGKGPDRDWPGRRPGRLRPEESVRHRPGDGGPGRPVAQRLRRLSAPSISTTGC